MPTQWDLGQAKAGRGWARTTLSGILRASRYSRISACSVSVLGTQPISPARGAAAGAAEWR